MSCSSSAGSSDEHVTRLMTDLLFEIDETVHRKTDGSKIVEFYTGKSVLITGATGFLGKLLLEKLLRTCKDIGKVYLLIRDKKNKEGRERLNDHFEDVVFSQLRIAHPGFRTKIKVIRGDISLPNLGINQEDLDVLQNEVNVVFHVAALVGMATKLSAATLSNVGGTKEILKISRNCQNLVSFVYVSTAYSFCPRKFIDEKIYDSPYEPDELLGMVETDREYVDSNQKKIIGDWPNTYAFTKGIAENAMKIHGQGIPACILRPGVVCSTFKEPTRSWTDNYYGMTGFIANDMMGLLRSFQTNVDIILDIVPADYVVNAIIAAAYNNYSHRQKDMKIYNYVSSPENPISNGKFFKMAQHYGKTTPTLKSIWYPYTIKTKYFHINLVLTIVLHFLPAILLDVFSTITGRKRRMVFVYKLLYKFNRSVSYFVLREWKFRNDKVQELWNNLSDTDKKIFNFSLSKSSFSWNEYLKTMNAGIRVYLLKDNLTTIPEALRKHTRLYYYNKFLQIILLLTVLWLSRLFLHISGPGES